MYVEKFLVRPLTANYSEPVRSSKDPTKIHFLARVTKLSLLRGLTVLYSEPVRFDGQKFIGARH